MSIFKFLGLHIFLSLEAAVCTVCIFLSLSRLLLFASEQTRKWRPKLTLVRLQTWSLTALREGMKILCIKDHVRFSINDFREGIRAITNPSFAAVCLN